MADTTAQTAIERWLVQRRLPKYLGQKFAKAKVKLTWGGSFEFDGVSQKGRSCASRPPVA